MLSNFPLNSGYNMAGLSSFLYAPIYSVLMIPVPGASMQISGVTFRQGFGWLKGYSTQETLQSVEEAKDTANGKYYAQRISGFVPGDTPALISILSEMNMGLFLVATKAMDGSMRLFGATEGLEFISSSSSGMRAGDSRGFSFEFNGEFRLSAPGIAQ